MDGESVVGGVVLDAAGKDTRGEIISNHPLISQVDSIDKHQLMFACVNHYGFFLNIS